MIVEATTTQPCRCASEECSCTDTADFIVNTTPMCGCCLGDCPDVHPQAHARRERVWTEQMRADDEAREMGSEGGPARPEPEVLTRLARVRVIEH